MPVPGLLRLVVCGLVADGVLALYHAEFLATAGLALVALLGVAACLFQARGPDALTSLPGGRWIVPVAALASTADLLYLSASILDALARLLLFLVLYKLATLRTVPDTRSIAFLAFFMLVLASTSAFGVGFLFALVAFVLLASWVALVQHVLIDESGGAVTGDPIPRRALAGLAGTAALAVVVIAGGLFFALPRVGIAALPLKARLGGMVTGFTDRVELGAFGSILTDSRVVMRVHLPDEPSPERLPSIRWRGMALDSFDGRVWSVRHPRSIRLLRPSAGSFELGVLRGSGRILRQEVFLEPIGSEAVFVAARPLRLSVAAPIIALDDMGAVTVALPGARLRYTVESEMEEPRGARIGRGHPAPPLPPDALERYLQLPPLAPEIPALARRVAGASGDPAQMAARLEQYFLREFRYTLDLEPGTRPDPLEDFLFVRRAGHCEYFAAAMAVMLRTLGVPARVVNGFQRGEWNPYGEYFIVRYSDAHSWVEAYLPGVGWTTFDPTPRVAGAPRARASWLLYLDAFRLQWNRYVINWSLRDQIRAVQSAHQRLAGVRAWSAALDPETRARLGRAAAMAALAAVAAWTAWLGWRRRPGAPAGPARGTPAFYARALRLLARRGLCPAAGETAREFSVRVAQLGPPIADAFGRLTRHYERVRFGGAEPGRAEQDELSRCLAALRGPRG